MLKKYGFWIVLTLVVLGGAWYWWNNNKPTTKKDEETKDTKNPANTAAATTATASNASGNFFDKNCGGLDAVLKKFEDPKETFFRNQWLGDPKFKCQTALAQHILNLKEKAGLVVDGDYGPASKAAVKKVFGKEQVNLNDFDVKYKLTKIVVGNDYQLGDISKTFGLF